MRVDQTVSKKIFPDLEQFVSLLPVLDGLLDTLEAGLVLDLEVSDEGESGEELRPLEVGLELHEVGRDLCRVWGGGHELGEELLVEDVEEGRLDSDGGMGGLGHDSRVTFSEITNPFLSERSHDFTLYYR